MTSDLSSAMGLTEARPVQRLATTGGRAADPTTVATIAAGGVAQGGGALPFLDQIQRAFGHHDVSGVSAHTGPAATAAAHAIGAEAYATGGRVAFGGQPTLHTAAHEAAHVVQQRAGVQLAGGLDSPKDRYEQHADAVADRVVQGRSAEALLDELAPSAVAASGGGAVQRMERDLEAQISYSDDRRMAVIGTRTQELYAHPDLIGSTNATLEGKGARIRLTRGAAWVVEPTLCKVGVEVVDNTDADTGVSDKEIAGPFLRKLQPLASDSAQERAEKVEKYRAFWRAQDLHMLRFSTKIVQFENRMYVERMRRDVPRPAPGYTPAELRQRATEAARDVGASGFHASFFHTLVTRNIIEEFDSHLGALRDKALTAQEIDAQIIATRRDNAQNDPFAAMEDSESDAESDPVAPARPAAPDESDLAAFPASELERATGKQAAYQARLDRGELWEHSYEASRFLRAKITKIQDQITEEIEADGATLIAPKRCSDTTRFLYAEDSLSNLELDQGGGRLHYSQNVPGLGNVFHSAGAIMQSGDDLVTLESANGSGALPVGKHTWWFQMYGKAGPTSFAEQTRARWSSIA